MHFRTGRDTYACRAGRRWASQDVSSTWGRRKVTCGNCLRTKAFTGGTL